MKKKDEQLSEQIKQKDKVIEDLKEELKKKDKELSEQMQQKNKIIEDQNEKLKKKDEEISKVNTEKKEIEKKLINKPIVNTKEEFCWYESRKHNRGTINRTLFDILCTRNYDEIEGKWGDTIYEPLGIAKIQCTIESALGAYDNPAVYTVKDVELLKGVDVEITEVASFTHTYAGEALDGEEVYCKGKVEKVIKENAPDYYRIVVGTTRESMDEYVKLREIPF